MTDYYELWHIIEDDVTEDDKEKLIGIYSSERKAQEAVKRLRNKPGFRDLPESHFDYGQRTLDEDGWPDGFFTWRPGDE